MKGWMPILIVVLVGVTLFGFSTWDQHRRAETERVEAARVAAIQAAEKATHDKRAAELKAQAAEKAAHDKRAAELNALVAQRSAFIEKVTLDAAEATLAECEVVRSDDDPCPALRRCRQLEAPSAYRRCLRAVALGE